MKNRTKTNRHATDLFGGALLSAGLAVAPATGDPIAVADRVIDTGLPRPTQVAAGDLDGDGAIDLITGAETYLLRYDSNGGSPPTFGPDVPFADAIEVDATAIADLDGDGDNDVVFLGFVPFGDRSIYWLENDGAGGFGVWNDAAGLDLDEPLKANVVVADLDGDGDLDIIAASYSTDLVCWLENDGAADPTFTYHEISTSIEAISVDVCDLDGDGATDFVVGAHNGNALWFESDGAPDPTFTERLLIDIGDRALTLKCADVDADGDTDLFFGGETFGSAGNAGWLENDGGSPPVFTRNNIHASSQAILDIAVGDFDADGDLDLVGGAALGSGAVEYRLRWWENDGAADPTFVEADLFDFGTGNSPLPRSIAAVDLDGDADQDFAVITGNRRLWWFENLTDPLPVITGQPVSLFVAAPTVAEFSVAATAATFYQWKLNGQDLSDDGVFSGTDTPALTVNATLATQGVYECVVGNIAGMVTSDAAVLGVAPSPSDCAGDINGDGMTDVFDFAEFATDFGCGTP